MIRDQRQALTVAVEMEKRAIRIYERALMIIQEKAVADGIRDILADEHEHLRRFTAMREEKEPLSSEERVLAEALAAEALFPGGVMEMKRGQGLNSVHSLYQFAARSEQEAIDQYMEFSTQCEDEDVRQIFRAIAREEATHLAALKRTLTAMEEGAK